jgi:hypothetical protein
MNEFLAAIRFVIINYLLWNNIFQIRRIGLIARSATWHDRVLTIGVLLWAQIVSIELLLGYLGWLRYDVALGVAALSNLVLRLAPQRTSSAPEHFAAPLRLLSSFKIERGLLVIGGAVMLVLAGMNAITPPTNWDSLTYHLTFPVEWFQHERLSLVPTAFGDLAPTYYPINAELVFLWLLLPLNSLAIPDLGQSMFVIGALIGVFGVARQLQLSVRASLWSVLLCMSLPMLLVDGMLWSYSDVAMAGAFVIVLYFTLTLLDDFTLSHSTIFGLALGLFIGTKSPSLIYGLPLCGWLVLGIARKVWSPRNRVKWGPVVLWIFPACVFGLHSYIRNWFVTGNPLFPLAVDIMGINIWPGYLTLEDYSANPFHSFDPNLLVVQPGYFPHWGYSLLAILLGLYQTRAIPFAQNRLRWLVLLWASLFVLFYFFTPLRDVRYLLPVQLVASLIAAISVLPMRRIWQIAIIGGHCIVGWAIVLLEMTYMFGRDPLMPRPISNTFTVQEWQDHFFELFNRVSLAGVVRYGLLTLFGICAIGIAMRYSAWFGSRAWRQLLWAGTVGITAAALLLVYDVNEYGAYERYFDGEIGVAWAWLNGHTQSDRIANIGNNVPLPLYGTRLKNRVFYISVNEKSALYEYGNTNPRASADYTMWIKNLSAEHVNMLFVTAEIFAAEPSFDIEDLWASTHPKEFALLYATNRVHIWRVISQPAAE